MKAWIFTNPTDKCVTKTVDISGWNEVVDLLGEPLEQNGDAVELSVAALDVRALVLRG